MPTEVTHTNTQAEHVLDKSFDRMRARLLNVVEASAIPQDQQDAIKRLVKTLSYDAQADILEAIAALARDR